MKVLVRWACVWMFTSMVGEWEKCRWLLSVCANTWRMEEKSETHQKVLSHRIMLWRWLRFQRSPCLASGRTTWAPSRHPSVTLRKSYPIRIFLAPTRNFSPRRIQISRSFTPRKNESKWKFDLPKRGEKRKAKNFSLSPSLRSPSVTSWIGSWARRKTKEKPFSQWERKRRSCERKRFYKLLHLPTTSARRDV